MVKRFGFHFRFCGNRLLDLSSDRLPAAFGGARAQSGSVLSDSGELGTALFEQPYRGHRCQIYFIPVCFPVFLYLAKVPGRQAKDQNIVVSHPAKRRMFDIVQLNGISANQRLNFLGNITRSGIL